MKPYNYFLYGYLVGYIMTGVYTYRIVEKLTDSHTAIRFAVMWPSSMTAVADGIVDYRTKK